MSMDEYKSQQDFIQDELDDQQKMDQMDEKVTRNSMKPKNKKNFVKRKYFNKRNSLGQRTASLDETIRLIEKV